MSQHAESSGEALGSVIDRWLAAPDTRALLRQLFGAVPQQIEVALPTVHAPARCLRGPEAMLTCSRAPDDGVRQAIVTIPVAQAASLVDRLLGGSGQAGVATRVGKLSDAECGLLAHAGARLLAESGAAWLVRDVVSASAAELEAACANAVVWPVRASGGGLSVELKLALSAQTARELVPALELDLVVRDRVEADALAGLEPGDLLASEGLRLTATSEGACGPVRLRVRGCADELGAMLERGRVDLIPGTGPALARARHDELAIVLARRTLDLLELARIVAGLAPAFTELELGAVRVELGGSEIAHGELVAYRGLPSVRVTRCESATSRGPQRA